MDKKRLYPFLAMAATAVIGIFIFITAVRPAFEGKLSPDSRAYAKINELVDEHIPDNGVYLLNTDEEDVAYLVLDGSYLNFSNEIPRYSEVTIAKMKDKLTIHLQEDWKVFSEKEDTELRIIYKILTDEDTEYIDVYKNDERSAFDSAILSGS